MTNEEWIKKESPQSVKEMTTERLANLLYMVNYGRIKAGKEYTLELIKLWLKDTYRGN